MTTPTDTVMDDEYAIMHAIELIEMTGTDSEDQRDRDARGAVNQLLDILRRIRSATQNADLSRSITIN